jgi:hypothetical protein
MDGQRLGIVIIAAGIIAVLVGLGVMTGALGWFGRLPGDIRIDSGNVRVYFPITSMILVSVVLSVLVAALRRVF